MVADALVPCVARKTAAMALIIMCDKQITVFHEEKFLTPPHLRVNWRYQMYTHFNISQQGVYAM